MKFILSLSAVLSLVLAAVAEVAPAGQPILLNLGTSNLCLAASGTADGSPVIIQKCVAGSGNPLATWVVTNGGSTGNAPATNIRLFNTTMCLDVKDGVNADGTKLQLFDCVAGNTNQLFNVHSVSQTAATITWTNKNKCVDLTNGNVTVGNVIQVFTCFNGNVNQLWNPEPAVLGGVDKIPPGGGTRFEMHEPGSQLLGCLSVASGGNGSPVIFQPCTFNEPGDGGPSEVWTLLAGNSQTGTGAVGQITTLGNMCLDVTNGGTANGVKLQIWQCVGNANQMWQVNADMTITWAGKGKCVDLTNGNFTAGNPIQSWDCTSNNPNQDWIQAPDN